jgi:hypothetical protein
MFANPTCMSRVLICFSKHEEVEYESDFITGVNMVMTMVNSQKFADFCFIDGDRVTYFMARPGRLFQKISTDCKNPYPPWNAKRQNIYLEMKMTTEERHRMIRTCETFAGMHIPYNLKDKVIYSVFLWAPDEIELFDVKKIADVQAVILFLRECLSKANPIAMAVKDLHSRTCGVDALFDALTPITTRIASEQLLSTLTHRL